MTNLVGKKNKGAKFWWHGTRREDCRERDKGRKEELLPKFMVLPIQRCNVK